MIITTANLRVKLQHDVVLLNTILLLGCLSESFESILVVKRLSRLSPEDFKQSLTDLIEKGYIERDGNVIRFTAKGENFYNEIIDSLN